MVETVAVRTPMREPLVWPGGTRHSGSGVLVQIHTDEGLVGVGEAPGPTLSTIQTIVDAELSQFLVGQDPLRVEWLVHRMEEFTRNWSRMGAYAIAGIEMSLLDLKGKALGVPVTELLGGLCRDRVPVVGYLFIDTPEANAAKAGAFVDAGYTELKLKVGRDFEQDHDTLAAIRDRVGPEVKIRIDANMAWSVPAAIKWIRGLERFDLQYVEQPVPDFDVQGLAQVRRSVAVPIAADEACTDVRSVLELIKEDACDVSSSTRRRPAAFDGRTRSARLPTLPANGARLAAGPSSASPQPATSTSSPRRPTIRSRATRTTRCRRATSSWSRSRCRTAWSRCPAPRDSAWCSIREGAAACQHSSP